MVAWISWSSKNRFGFFTGFSWYSYFSTWLGIRIQQQAKKSTAEYSCYWRDHLKGTWVLGIFSIRNKRKVWNWIGQSKERGRCDAIGL
jgi:hypothetical protein